MDNELDREDTNMDGTPTTPKAEGTRLSAPEDSSGSSDELIAEPARETGTMYSNRCRANSSDSEELIPAIETGPADGLESQKAKPTFAFPAPEAEASAQGGPERWNQLHITHVNKRLLQRWAHLSAAKAETPSSSAFLQAFFLTRPDANGESILNRLQRAEASIFAGFDRFATTDMGIDCGPQDELLVGYHGTHVHTLWSIMRAGVAESGPCTPGSRFFQLPKSDGTTADVLQRDLLFSAIYTLQVPILRSRGSPSRT